MPLVPMHTKTPDSDQLSLMVTMRFLFQVVAAPVFAACTTFCALGRIATPLVLKPSVCDMKLLLQYMCLLKVGTSTPRDALRVGPFGHVHDRCAPVLSRRHHHGKSRFPQYVIRLRPPLHYDLYSNHDGCEVP